MRHVKWVLAVGILVTGWPNVALAQVTPAAGYTPPDDTPSIRVGVTLFPQFTLQNEPEITDAAGNSVNRSAFDVGRAYINIVTDLVRQYRLAFADRYLDEGLTYCTDQGLEGYLAFQSAQKAQVLFHRGRWHEAAELAGQVSASARTTKAPTLALTVLGRLGARRGRRHTDESQ